MNRDARPWYFWPLITFVVGLLLGWLVIGWWLWPVKWNNALPQDLSPKMQSQYLTMVAESYAANGDLKLAQDRLAGWPQEELSAALSNTQENLTATDLARATTVQSLASALSLSMGVSGAGPLPTAEPPQPTATSIPSDDGGPAPSWTRICTALLWVLLVLAAFLLFAFLFRRWRAAQQGQTPPSLGGLTRSFQGDKPVATERTRDDPYESRLGMAEQTAAEVAEEAKRHWDDAEPADWREVSAPGVTPSRVSQSDRDAALLDNEDVADEGLPHFMPPKAETRRPIIRPSTGEPPVETRQPVSSLRGGGTGPKLGDFVAVYQMGEPDYDEAFDIIDPTDGLVGQCGLQLNEPVGRNRDQAVALQAWLWDSSDPDTRVKVLMGEAAYRDTATRAQHISEHEAIPVRQGTDFELESHDLLLRGRVERVEYAEQDANRTIFADLQVRMQVYRKS